MIGIGLLQVTRLCAVDGYIHLIRQSSQMAIMICAFVLSTTMEIIMRRLAALSRSAIITHERSIIQGLTPIVATANGLNKRAFLRYELYISRAGAEAWNHLIASERQYWQNTIYRLDTTQWPNGFYDLRLRILFTDGNYNQFHLRDLQIANTAQSLQAYAQALVSSIDLPVSGQTVSGTVNFTGTATDPNFLRWELYVSVSGRNQWSFLVSEDEQAFDSLLARLDLSQLAQGYYDFRLRVVRNDYNYNEYYAYSLRVVPPQPTATPTAIQTAIPTAVPTPTPRPTASG